MKFNIRKTLNGLIAKEVADHPDATVNYEGGIAFDADEKTRLLTQVLSCFVNEPRFYGDDKTQTAQIIEDAEKVASEDPQFLINLAKVARHEFHMRTVPTVLCAVLAHNVKGRQGMDSDIATVISRADELTEMLAAYQAIYGETSDGKRKNPIPAVLKRAVAKAFGKFDEYQLAKYNREGTFKLKDALRTVISQLKENNKERRLLYKKVLDNQLKVPDTWETVISTKGSTKANWEAAFPKMGYMALLRNLRNFQQKNVDLKPVLEKIADPVQVRKSKQFPYRFYSAYKEIDDGKIKTALTTALKHATANLPRLKGTTFISADNSASMQSPVSGKSKMMRSEVADLMQAMTFTFCDEAICSVFGESFEVVEADANDSIITNLEKFKNKDVGHSTNAYLALKWLNDKKKKVDRIIIFSDMQCYDASNRYDPYNAQSLAAQLKEYKKKINPDVIMYSVDLAGYGTLQFPKDENNVALIAGWSDGVFRFIECYEKGSNKLIEYIQNYHEKPGQDEE